MTSQRDNDILKDSDMKNWFKEALILGIGLIVIGWGIYSGLNKFSSNQRTVTVKGLSEREVKADKVTWPVCVKLAGNDIKSINSQIASSNQAVRDFLMAGGIAADEITVNAPDITDRDAEQYSNRTGGYRYVATTVLTVVTDKVDLVRELSSRSGELLNQGIAVASDYQYRISYEFTGLNDIKPGMIEEATKNARAAAEKFAKDSDSRLGKIKTATQGQFSIYDRDEYSPSIKKVRVVTTVVYYLKG